VSQVERLIPARDGSCPVRGGVPLAGSGKFDGRCEYDKRFAQAGMTLISTR
jgi:hypothetical protein